MTHLTTAELLRVESDDCLYRQGLLLFRQSPSERWPHRPDGPVVVATAEVLVKVISSKSALSICVELTTCRPVVVEFGAA